MCVSITNLFNKYFNPTHTKLQHHLYTNYIFTNNPNKFAITIGIYYKKYNSNNNNLFDCINDLNNINEFLLEKCNFSSSNIISLCNDEANNKNIQISIQKMILFSQNNPDAELWFSFSGHGSQKNSFIETDGNAEPICPVDYKTNGYVSDIWLNSNFCNKLSDSSKLFVLMDCCHSGSNLDLQYKFVNNKLLSVGTSLSTKAAIIKISRGFAPNSLSGCKDSEVSSDYYENYENYDQEHQGALTNAFLDTNHHSIFSNRIKDINHLLSTNHFKQTTLLTLSKPNLIHWSLYDKQYELII